MRVKHVKSTVHHGEKTKEDSKPTGYHEKKRFELSMNDLSMNSSISRSRTPRTPVHRPKVRNLLGKKKAKIPIPVRVLQEHEVKRFDHFDDIQSGGGDGAYSRGEPVYNSMKRSESRRKEGVPELSDTPSLRQWNSEFVEEWFSTLGEQFEKYKDHFMHADGKYLFNLEEEDLVFMNMVEVDRKVLLQNLKRVKDKSKTCPAMNRDDRRSLSELVEGDFKHIVRALKPMKQQLNHLRHNQYQTRERMNSNQTAMVYAFGFIILMMMVTNGTFALKEDSFVWIVFDLFNTYKYYVSVLSFLATQFVTACYLNFLLILISMLIHYPQFTIGLISLYYAQHYSTWKQNFSRRSYRSEGDCHSNKPRPSMRGNVHNDIGRSAPTLVREDSYRPYTVKQGQKQNPEIRVNKTPHVSNTMLKSMDHIYIPLGEYLTLATILTPNSTFLMFFGNVYWKIRSILIGLGLLQPIPCDWSNCCTELILHTSIVRNFIGIDKMGGDEIATFQIDNFRIIDEDSHLTKIMRLEVKLNLTKRRVHSNTLHWKGITEELNCKDLLVILYFHDITSNHVQGHTFANWGIDNEAPNDFIRHMSNCTILYNYFGFTATPWTFKVLNWAGIHPVDFDNMTKVFEQGVECPIVNHSDIRRLAKYSKWVRFIAGIRNHFMNTFDEYAKRGDMGRVDGEALFVGSIIHSLDHLSLEQCIDEITWFDAQRKDFEPMMWFCRIVRSGYVPTLPCISFDYKYKDAPHGFFQKVYQRALILDREYANEIDCCILK